MQVAWRCGNPKTRHFPCLTAPRVNLWNSMTQTWRLPTSKEINNTMSSRWGPGRAKHQKLGRVMCVSLFNWTMEMPKRRNDAALTKGARWLHAPMMGNWNYLPGCFGRLCDQWSQERSSWFEGCNPSPDIIHRGVAESVDSLLVTELQETPHVNLGGWQHWRGRILLFWRERFMSN